VGTVEKLLNISNRLDHLEQAAEWIAKETVHSDNGVSQTGTLISVLADEIREKICLLVRELESDLREVLSAEKLN